MKLKNLISISLLTLVSINTYAQLNFEFSAQTTPKFAKQHFGKWRGAVSHQKNNWKVSLFGSYAKGHFQYNDCYRYTNSSNHGYHSVNNYYTYSGVSIIEFIETGLDLGYVLEKNNFQLVLGATVNLRKSTHLKDYDELRTYDLSSGWGGSFGGESQSSSGSTYTDLDMFSVKNIKFSPGVFSQLSFYIKDFIVLANVRLLYSAKYAVPNPKWEGASNGNYIDYRKFLDLEYGIGVGYRIKYKN